MSKRSFAFNTWSPVAVADAANIVDEHFMAIGCVAATDGLNVLEIYIGGQASASSIMNMLFSRNLVLATAHALGAGASDGPLNTLTKPTQAQAGSVTGTNATVQPQRTSATTSAKLNLSMNAFGGIVRWVAAPGEEWGIVGVATSISESSLSNLTGGATAAIGSHIIYEPL